jgi:hypothetical protein
MRYSNRTFLRACLVVIAFSCCGQWVPTADAQAVLDVSDPGLVRGKVEVTASDPTNATRQFDPAKFKIETKPTGIINAVVSSQKNGVVEIAPLKSGKTTLSIEYADGSTTLKGTRDIIVPYSALQIALGDEPLKLLSGESRTYEVFGVDIKGGTARVTQAVVSSSDSKVVKVSFAAQKLKLEADNAGSAEFTVSVLGVDSTPIKVQVTEGIAKIEIENRGAVSSETVQVVIPEGETRQLRVRIVGPKGTEFKRADVRPETRVVAASDTCGVPLEATYDEKDPAILNITVPILTGGAGCTGITRSVVLSVPGRKIAEDGSITDVETTINVTITPKVGFITLTSSSEILTQNGRITIDAEVFGRSNTPVFPPPDVNFRLKDPTKDGVWVGLVKEGNRATLVWRNPSQQEIKDANQGQVVSRPSEVVVIATTRVDSRSPEIESRIIIGMGEVVGFSFIKVKLNIMDERTAGDLYGRVTSQEYYVLTVRLFNNLRDEITKQFTGDSILAYSSSIEVAVGLEKKFDRKGSNSYFPYVITKGEATKRAVQRAAVASTQFDRDMTEAQRAQADLNSAVETQYTSRKTAIDKVNEAAKKRVRAEKLTLVMRGTSDQTERRSAFEAANDAINEYNAAMVEAASALETASVAEDEVIRLRAAHARAATGRALIRPDIALDGDLNTAIDDGLWHPLTPADLNRLGPIPAPAPEPARDLNPLPLLSESELNAVARAISPQPRENLPPADENAEPPCVGVITYRPFTFEMMVNTVDRRDNRSFRARVFKVLDFIGTGTSFVTSVAVPGSSSDLPLGLEKYRNLLLPGLDKLYPNFKEQQRQNIVSQAMKEIEEIPFGSDITRVIFIPKKNMHGLVRGHDVRISEVCPFFFRIQVAIVKKHGVVEQGSIVRQ